MCKHKAMSSPPSHQEICPHLPSLLLQIPDLLGNDGQAVAGVCSDEVTRLQGRMRLFRTGAARALSGHFHARDLDVRWRSHGHSLAQGLDRAVVVQELPREL